MSEKTIELGEVVAHFGLSNADAKLWAVELEKVRESGPLTAKRIVEHARPKKSPLNRFFEWDDGVAAEKYRIEQARYYQGAVFVRVTVKEPEKAPRMVDVRAYRSVSRAAPNGGPATRDYVPHAEAMSNPEWKKQLLAGFLDQIERLRESYGHIVETAPVFDAAQAVRKSAQMAKRKRAA